MGLTANVVSNTPITAAWGNEIRDRTNQNFATVAERASQWTAPPEGAFSYIRDVDQVHVYTGTIWVCITPVAAATNTADTRTNTAYGDGAGGAGPAVTLLTGTKALVMMSAVLDNGGGTSAVFMGYAVSGATTLAATDNEALAFIGPAGSSHQTGYESYVTGLTPGSNTFTAKYRAAAGTVSYNLRKIRVVGLPG